MERIEKLEAMLAQNEGDSFLQHALALEYVKLGDEVTARRLFEELLHRDADYVGSYYHLAKLLERLGEVDAAKGWYEKGMQVAQRLGDRHALGELRMAWEEISY